MCLSADVRASFSTSDAKVTMSDKECPDAAMLLVSGAIFFSKLARMVATMVCASTPGWKK